MRLEAKTADLKSASYGGRRSKGVENVVNDVEEELNVV